VTSNAAILWPRGAAHVLGVIELHVEVFFEAGREGSPWRIVAVQVAVADRAERRVGCRVLRPMAFDTVPVSGKAGLRRIIVAMMAGRAGQRRVTLAGVQKF